MGGGATRPVLGGCGAARWRPVEGRGGAWRRRGSGAVRRPSWHGTRAPQVFLVLRKPDPRTGPPDPGPRTRPACAASAQALARTQVSSGLDGDSGGSAGTRASPRWAGRLAGGRVRGPGVAGTLAGKARSQAASPQSRSRLSGPHLLARARVAKPADLRPAQPGLQTWHRPPDRWDAASSFGIPVGPFNLNPFQGPGFAGLLIS